MLVVATPEAIDLIIRLPEGVRSPEGMQALFAMHNSHIDGSPLS